MPDFVTRLPSLLAQRPIPVAEIVSCVAHAADDPLHNDVTVVKQICELHGLFDEQVADPAIAFLPAWGIGGIDLLIQYAFNGPRNSTALSVLGAVVERRCPSARDVLFLGKAYGAMLRYPVPDSLAEYALTALRSSVLECVSDQDKKEGFLWSIASLGMIPETENCKSWFNFYVDLLIDSHLVVNRSMISEFESLLDSAPDREEVLQKFLTRVPVLLDPFVTELRSKHQLGDDFITDFVVRRINNEYVLVEIEKSTDRVFTSTGQFTAQATRAMAQVRDFQAWITHNMAYSQKKLPGICRPEGLVVIGRQRDLSDTDQKRLDEENFSRRGHIKVLTYDDLLRQAKTVHSNLVSHPIVLRARDQRTI